MIDAVGGKQIFRIVPARALTRLRGIAPIRSFEIGKSELEPVLRKLFAREGFTPGEIHLDLPAKARLLAMKPTLVQRVEKEESAESIFSSLELSLFTGENQKLYLLGDSENINSLRENKEVKRALPIRLWRMGGITQVAETPIFIERCEQMGFKVSKIMDDNFNLGLPILIVSVDAERIKEVSLTVPGNPDSVSTASIPTPQKPGEWANAVLNGLNLSRSASNSFGQNLGQLTLYYRDGTERKVSISDVRARFR